MTSIYDSNYGACTDCLNRGYMVEEECCRQWVGENKTECCQKFQPVEIPCQSCNSEEYAPWLFDKFMQINPHKFTQKQLAHMRSEVYCKRKTVSWSGIALWLDGFDQNISNKVYTLFDPKELGRRDFWTNLK